MYNNDVVTFVRPRKYQLAISNIDRSDFVTKKTIWIQRICATAVGSFNCIGKVYHNNSMCQKRSLRFEYIGMCVPLYKHTKNARCCAWVIPNWVNGQTFNHKYFHLSLMFHATSSYCTIWCHCQNFLFCQTRHGVHIINISSLSNTWAKKERLIHPNRYRELLNRKASNTNAGFCYMPKSDDQSHMLCRARAKRTLILLYEHFVNFLDLYLNC